MRSRSSRFYSFLLPIFSASGVLASGCATVANTHTARPILADGRASDRSETPSGLTISGEEVDELSSRHFGVLAVTFENPTSEWVRIDSVNLDFGNDALNQSMFVPWGEDIVSWEQATSQRLAIRRANTSTILSVLAVGGTLAAGLGRRSGVAVIGGAVALGSVTALWSKAVADQTSAATFPPSHLFATPFSVPPGLFAKKWVLLNGPTTPEAGCIHSVSINYVTAKGPERVRLAFARDGSDWQRSACVTQEELRGKAL
jgi:hypothetical protein